jgi:hypothetical protein
MLRSVFFWLIKGLCHITQSKGCRLSVRKFHRLTSQQESETFELEKSQSWMCKKQNNKFGNEPLITTHLSVPIVLDPFQLYFTQIISINDALEFGFHSSSVEGASSSLLKNVMLQCASLSLDFVFSLWL